MRPHLLGSLAGVGLAAALLTAPAALASQPQTRTLTLEVRHPASIAAAVVAAQGWGTAKINILVVAGGGADCSPSPGRAVLCYDSTIPTMANASPNWGDTCIIRVAHASYAAAGIIAHELGHCLGMGHADVGVMSNGGGLPTAADVVAKEALL